MKGKAVLSRGIPKAVIDELNNQTFVCCFIEDIIKKQLGAKNPLERPAEYYVQEPDFIIQAVSCYYAVEFRLTGVTRNGRTPSQLHRALNAMHLLVKETIRIALVDSTSEERIQMFCVLMLDGDIETRPGSGEYSTVLESDAEWISAQIVG